MSDDSLSKISCWDEKAKSFEAYIGKIKAYAIIGIGDALDHALTKQLGLYGQGW